MGLSLFASGVRVGPGARLPRLPALYPRKKRWRLPRQSDPLDYQEGREDAESVWRRNYSFVEKLSDKVLDVLQDQEKRGQVLRYSEREARELYPNLTVASLGAIRKEKPGSVITARVLFDGTHGIAVNHRTRVRDQERAPIAADIKRIMREKSLTNEPTFALTADVSEAHRQVPIDRQDWHLLGCQVRPGEDVFVNTVGTFGVASASYYWSRVASSVGRLCQYIPGGAARTWHLLVADDFHLEAGGPAYREALMVFFVLCSVAGIPLEWPKTAGGNTVSWVGFELLHRSYKVGLSERRAQWFHRWTREVADAGYVHMDAFEEGLGRVMYVAGALEYERPFLGPLYKFLALQPRGTVQRLPSYVVMILRYLAEQVMETRHYDCAAQVRVSDTAPRVDAQASDDRAGIGGWCPVLDSTGLPSPALSRWFSMEVTREHFPWVFRKGGKASKVIATLESLAALMALKVFYGDDPSTNVKKIQLQPTWTDNRGNGSALNKLMSTRYPVNALLMELACHCKHTGTKAIVEWAPRSANRQADDLANGRTSSFDPSLEVKIDPAAIQWRILPRALAMGLEAEETFQRAKDSGRLPVRTTRQKRKKAAQRLRVADPW